MSSAVLTISVLLESPALANKYADSVVELLRAGYDNSQEKAEIKWIQQLYDNALAVQVDNSTKANDPTKPTSFSSTNFNKMCFEHLKQEEGSRTAAYYDINGNLTIGIGHLVKRGDPYTIKTVLTEQQVLDLFYKDLPIYQKPVEQSITVGLPSKSLVALVGVVYNIGHMPPTLAKFINTQQWAKAASFWVRDPEMKNPQLTDRRKREVKLFMKGLGFR